MRAIFAVSAVLVLSGCSIDGSFLVRGRILGTNDHEPAPIAGAEVSVEGSHGRSTTERTAADGTFELEYRSAGRFPFVWGDGDPRLRVRARGFKERDVKLDGQMPAGVTQRPCALGQRGCRHVEVVLAPEPVPTS
jgi:hypothetical protein